MDMLSRIKQWIGALTDIGLLLLALAIVATVLVGSTNLPFFGGVVDNIIGVVKNLGANGLVGRKYDVLAVWRDRATQVSGKALPGGHWLAEELPDVTLAELRQFLAA